MGLLLTEYFTVQETLNQKFENLIEEISSNEFITEVGDKIFEETGKTFDDEQVKRMIGEMLVPQLLQMSKVVIDQ
jgi:chaperonin cofactor prefoldin